MLRSGSPIAIHHVITHTPARNNTPVATQCDSSHLATSNTSHINTDITIDIIDITDITNLP